METGKIKALVFVLLIVLLTACNNSTEGQLETTPEAEQEIIFFADTDELPPGGCTVIRWEVFGSYQVWINAEEVPSAGEMDVCPEESQAYILEADFGNRMEERGVEIFIAGEVAPPTEEHDDQATEATGPREPQEIPEISPGTPAYQTSTWQRTSGPPGGLGYDIRMDPRNPDIMYVTDAWAGAFKSTNGGESWFPINNGITARVGRSGDGIPVFSLTIDPNNPDTLWVGTQFGGGVFRSDDAGHSWYALNNGIQERALTIRGFTVQQGNSDVVYLAGEISSWEWNNDVTLPGLGLDMTKGAIYKTTNGGQNWTRIWYGDNLGRYIWIHPENPNLIYASTGIFDREAANSNPDTLDPGGVGVLRSRDGGETWEVLGVENGFLENELYIGSLFMHPENPDILIAAAANDSYFYKLGSPLGGIYLTEDGGDSWDRVLGLDNASTVEICESNPEVVYAGSYYGIHRSDDGGHTWQETMGLLWGSKDAVAGFPIDMLCDPNDPMRIYVNNYIGGNFLSEDGGYTWTLAADGYSGALMKRVDVSYSDPTHVYSASRMGVFLSHNAGDTWTGTARGLARAPEAVFISVDPFDAEHIITQIGDVGPDPLVSWDEGQTWTVVSRFGQKGSGQMGTFSNVFFSPYDPSTVLATVGSIECRDYPSNCAALKGDGILYSTDRGQSWERSNLTDLHVMDLVFASESLMYAAAYPDIIYLSRDSGQTWEQVVEGIMPITLEAGADPDMMFNYSILALGVDPLDPNHVLAGFLDGGLLVSRDGGLTWDPISAGLMPETSVTDIEFDPAHPGVVYLGSSNLGVFYSTDGGLSWVQHNSGLLNRKIWDLDLSRDGSILYAATEGGGVFRLGYQPE